MPLTAASKEKDFWAKVFYPRFLPSVETKETKKEIPVCSSCQIGMASVFGESLSGDQEWFDVERLTET